MGDLLNGRYELGEVVGTGGMGAVRRAIDTRLGRIVAIKVLRGGAMADDMSRSRMRSEARLASSIHHPGVAQVFDYDAESATHGGMSFIVMEYVDGQSLAQLLREHGAMSPDQVMSIIHQVADALAAAHAAGVVHRDLKPANIMLTPAGRTVLVDFGIARSETSEPLTDTGTLLGTADYFSPEQAAGRPASPQSDLYSLGIVAHHCLTGRPPFRRDNHIATALAHLHDDLPPLDPSVPAPVRDLVAHLTEKSPFDRPATAAAVAREAAGIGAAPAIDMPPTVSLPTAEDLGGGTSSTVHLARRAPWSRRTKVLFSGVGAAAAVLLFMGLGGMQSEAASPVPRLVGMDVAEATKVLQSDDLGMTRTTVDVPGTPAGEIVSQSPDSGDTAPEDGLVDVTVASGKVAVPADTILGTTYATASTALEKLGLTVARRDVTSSTDVGEVVALDRSGRVPDGSTITLSVAVAAPEPAAVPAASRAASSSSSSGSSGSSGPSKGDSAKTKKAKGSGKKK